MIKTIKVKNNLRLDELIKYVWENHLYPETFKSNFNDFVYFDKVGKLNLIDARPMNQATTFTVEVEEPITESTVFDTLVDVNNNDEVHIAWNDSISLYDKEQTKEIHALINGKLQLIWEAE